MLVLTKKQILTMCFFISLFVIVLSSIESKGKENTILTSSLPISNHTIILDAGHGSPDGGAESQSGVLESDLNLEIVLKLQELLEQSGSVVILTRSDENGIYDENKKTIREKKVSDMKNRVEISKTSEAEIFVSIHLNKIAEDKYSGYQTFYQKNSEDSKMLAEFIQENLNYSIQKKNKREIQPLSGKYIMDNVKIPTVTVECGFLSNPEETKALQTEEYQERLAWGIYMGIMDYFYE